ncbi:MAG: cytochrome P450 family protein [Geminicoccales bacterium]
MVKQQKFDLRGQAFKRDPMPTFAAMRAAGPVVPSKIPLLGKVSFATTFTAAESLLKDKERFIVDPRGIGDNPPSRVPWWFPKRFRPLTESMLGMDDPDHRRLRRLVDRAFHQRNIESYRAMIQDVADRMIEEAAASDDGDLIRHVARPIPLVIISELLGLPNEDRPQLIRWMAGISTVSSVLGAFRMLPALQKLSDYLKRHFEMRRIDPRDDLISALVAVEEEGDQLSEDELLAMCFILFVAGHETTTHLISGGVLALLQHPDQLAWLRADPALMPSAVDELLRFVSPVQMSKPRYSVETTSLDGVDLQKGQRLMALLASANADPDAFEKPEQLDLGRTPNRHLAFGQGPHLCLGLQLARAEMAIVLERLLQRYPELKLAIGEEKLGWTKRIGLRALKALPVRNA